MARLCAAMLVYTLMLASLSVVGADNEQFPGSVQDSANEIEGERRSIMPYWNLWSSDFYGWLEELRAQAAYDTILDLARSYWAHFPIASYLGYDSISDLKEQSDNERDN